MVSYVPTVEQWINIGLTVVIAVACSDRRSSFRLSAWGVGLSEASTYSRWTLN